MPVNWPPPGDDVNYLWEISRRAADLNRKRSAARERIKKKRPKISAKELNRRANQAAGVIA